MRHWSVFGLVVGVSSTVGAFVGLDEGLVAGDTVGPETVGTGVCGARDGALVGNFVGSRALRFCTRKLHSPFPRSVNRSITSPVTIIFPPTYESVLGYVPSSVATSSPFPGPKTCSGFQKSAL